ncbi:WD repeat-containing protein 75 [Grifola frondosa]|uniref:WD repeat-containing protein 75 n=1 Tax=Grifola frondosa TaxID=5627 RepID=A0A1C7MSU2_GRIFR|nr:WD repeat-containing protein 75 [Grifola frondosa]
MPVAVAKTRAMPASDAKTSGAKVSQDIPLPDSPKAPSHPRKRRKAKGKQTDEEEECWSWKSLTDSSASRVPPLFTKDGSYFFSAVGPSVKIYSTATGEVISTLNVPASSTSDDAGSSSQSDVITATVLNPHNSFQLITGSLDGFIRVWDFLDAVLLQTINLSQSIFHLTAHEKFRDCVVVAVARPTKKKTSKVLRVSLRPTNATAGLPIQISSNVSGVGKTRSTTGLVFSPSGAWLVATAGHKAYVCSTADFKAGFTKFVSPERLTCLAFHPSEEYFATGDASGCIRLWYCLNEDTSVKTVGVQKTAQTTTLHWHAHAVSSIAFTGNGAYLLSGGEEAVFVIWQLHTGKREYVPRVGAPILHVTLSKAKDEEEEYLLSLADASFVFIRAGSLKISRAIARIKLDPAISHDRPSKSTAVPLAIHSLTSTLILPSSHPTSLQTFAPSTSKLVSELEVSPSNRVSRRDEKPLEPSRIERVVVCDSGEWMATIDSREADEAFRGEVYMKIWWWDRKAGFWILNTRIDRPHGLRKVTGVAFRPKTRDQDSLFLVTTGEDGNVKAWRIRSTKTKSGDVEDFWVARSTFRFRSEIPTDVSWSPEGSLLAVSVGPYVAIYDPDTNALLQVLTCAECKVVSSARFVGVSGRFLAVHGAQDVMLWDLISQTMRWHYHSPSAIDQLISHPEEEAFAVFEHPSSTTAETPSTRVLIFRPSSPSPSASWTLPFQLRSVISDPFLNSLSSDPSFFTLVGITQSWTVVVFGDGVKLPDEEGATAQVKWSQRERSSRTSSAKPRSPMFPPALPYLPPSMLRNHGRGKGIAEIFDAPAYLMPPLESLFDSVMDGFLTARPEEKPRDSRPEQEPDRREEEEEMDVDAEEETSVVMGARIERHINRQEMDGFVDLFVQYAIKAPPRTQQPVPPPPVNGIHKPNGHAWNHRNGGHAAPPVATRVSTKRNGIAPKVPNSAPTVPSNAPSSAVKVGKKRKKSLG